jgi:hypothetical protein
VKNHNKAFVRTVSQRGGKPSEFLKTQNLQDVLDQVEARVVFTVSDCYQGFWGDKTSKGAWGFHLPPCQVVVSVQGVTVQNGKQPVEEGTAVCCCDMVFAAATFIFYLPTRSLQA